MNNKDHELGVLILAGGRSERMGMDKSLLPFEGRTFIECLVDQCNQLSRHLVISVGHGEPQTLKERFGSQKEFSRVTWIEDEHRAKGPMAGIAAGLRTLEPVCRYAFVTGCDVPLIKAGLANELFRIAEQHDCRAVTPVDGKRVFGMTAVYRTDSWTVAGELIQQDSLRVSQLAEQLAARQVEVSDLRKFDPELDSFLNINHPQAYRDFLTSQGYDADADLIEKLTDSAEE